MSQQPSGEKTEKASAKKRRDARKKGEVHKSHDLSSALMLFFLFGAIRLGYGDFMVSMQQFVAGRMSASVVRKAAQVSSVTIVQDYRDLLLESLPLILPFMLATMLCGVMVNVVQTGPLFVTTKLKPDFKRISPIQGFKRIFSSQTLMSLFKSMIKVVILGVVIYKGINNNMDGFANLLYVDAGKAFSQVMMTCFSVGINMALALIAFSLIDVFYQWWKYEKDLRMTKQEVKEEFKQMEGDPLLRSRIKQRQRKLSAMRMMQRLPEAAVVVTNPDHYAVALRYQEAVDRAPIVVAKGQDYLAVRIKALAKKYDISIVENKPVARALYASCEIGDEIPPEMYQAIADILIYVYKVLKR